MMNYRSEDEKQQGRIKKAMNDITDAGGRDYIYRQLAEECAELAQAALKLVRANSKETPMSTEEATIRMAEEIADVRLMLDIVETACITSKAQDDITKFYHAKLNRFRERLLPL
jgi:NTP pyrophosphatase (non-canonical NTP hydrolase)